MIEAHAVEEITFFEKSSIAVAISKYHLRSPPLG